MAVIWIALLLAVVHLSNGHKLLSTKFEGTDLSQKYNLTVEDPSTSNTPTASLYQWLPKMSHSVPTKLKHNSSKLSHVARAINTTEDLSLEELTTALEEELTTKTVTIKTDVIHGASTAGPKHTYQTDITQTELSEEVTSHLLTQSSPSSTVMDTARSTGLGISGRATDVSAESSTASHPNEIIDPTLTSVTENSTNSFSTHLVDSSTVASDIPTSTPVDNLTTTSGFNLSHTDKPHSTDTTSTPDVTNGEDSWSEKLNPMSSLMGQCLLAISILAFIATVFIICTVVLATKLSNLRHSYKLLTKNSTEMVCISSLLPDSDQAAAKNKAKMNKMKTFATNVEESDGDNLTLNSFLPDH